MPSVDVPVALLGYGTVGAAVHRLLEEQGEEIERATGHRLRVVRALVRDTAKERGFEPAAGVLTSDPADVLGGRRDRSRRGGDGRRRAGRLVRARAPRLRPLRRHREQAARRPTRRGAVRGRRDVRRAAALRGIGVRCDPRDQGAAGVARLDERPSRRRHRQRDDELRPLGDGRRQELRGGARRGAAARVRGGRPIGRRGWRRCRGEARDPLDGRVRLARAARVGRDRGDRGTHAGARPGGASARHEGQAPRARDAQPTGASTRGSGRRSSTSATPSRRSRARSTP